MNLQQQIDQDWKAAVKSRNVDKNILSYIRSEIQAKAKERKIEAGVPDDIVFGVLKKLAKQRREALMSMKNRPDLAEKERAELGVIERYLDQQKMMGDEELQAAVSEIIDNTGAQGPKDMGLVMKTLMGQYKGKVDGKLAQQVVQAALIS